MTMRVEYAVEVDHKGEDYPGADALLERFLEHIGRSSRPVPTSPSRSPATDASVTGNADVRTVDDVHVIEYNLTLETNEDLRTGEKESLKSQLVQWIREKTSDVTFGWGAVEVVESWTVHTE
jgi:hypothetical protein